MYNIEILAPSGNKECFISAINAGANAIYLAGKNFGARKYASNFTNEEIKNMISYAHLRNVKLFVTVNTIIFEEEIEDLLYYTDFLVLNKVDALIVQDIGLINILTKRYPNTEIHASTQMNTYTVSQAKYLKGIGVSRIILAREASIETIKKIKAEVDIDIEVFIHGALCVSYSGNCLFSALNGGRSGNRGECAQPCRLPYSLQRGNTLVTDESYLMSTKDLISINHLEEIINAGAISLKVEGRMRSVEYVTATIRAYKEALDAYQNYTSFDFNTRYRELLTVFNRDYTKGYISNEKPFQINNSYRPNHQGIEVGKVLAYNKGKVTIDLTNTLSKNDGIRFLGTKDTGGKVNRIIKNDAIVEQAFKGDRIVLDVPTRIEHGAIVRKTQDTHLNKELSQYLDENFNLIPVYMNISAHINQKLKMTFGTLFTSPFTIESDYTIPQANKNPQSQEQLVSQFSKLGNTPFYAEQITIDSEYLGFIPNSVINQLRRDSINKLEEHILSTETPIINKGTSEEIQPITNNFELIIKVETQDQYNLVKTMGIDKVYYTKNIEGSLNNYLFLPRISNDEVFNQENLVIQDFGQLRKAKNIRTNEHFNIVNSYSVETLIQNGVESITLSSESTFDNTRKLITNFKHRHGFYPPLEVILYNRPDLMISKYCPITKGENINKIDCGICEKYNYSLLDTKNQSYPIKRDYQCNVRILHNKVINNINMVNQYKRIGIKKFRIDFTTESKEQVITIIRQIKKELNL